MFNQSTTLIAVNNALLFNNQNLFQGLYSSGLQVRNKTSINTKESLISEVGNYKPTFVLISSNLPGVISLCETLKKIKEASPLTKAVLFVDDNDKGNISKYLAAGTNAILWASTISENLDFAIRQLKKSQSFMCSKCIEDLRYSLQAPNTDLKFDFAQLSLLTDREVEVLFALTKGTNYKQISKQLFISESTVKTHVNNIFTKLHVNDRTQAVLYALNHGISSLVKNPDILKNALEQKAIN